MKKTIFLCLMAMSFCLGGFAQKGRQAVGIDVPFRFNDSFDDYSLGIGLKYQYNINDYIRIEPMVQYFYEYCDNDNFKFIGAVNSAFFFKAPARFRPYGVIGLGFAAVEVGEDYGYGYIYEWEHNNGFYFQWGLGIDYRLSYDWSWQLEAGGQATAADDDFFGIYISTGITYNF